MSLYEEPKIVLVPLTSDVLTISLGETPFEDLHW